MRAASRLLAKASTVGTPSGGLGVVPHALLPPIPLYRRLLRGHRKHLPPEMRLLGDEYIKSEFRAHRGVDNPIHIVSGPGWRRSLVDQSKEHGLTKTQIGFLTEWQGYAQQIEGEKWRGDKMDKAKIDKMSGSCSTLNSVQPWLY